MWSTRFLIFALCWILTPLEVVLGSLTRLPDDPNRQELEIQALGTGVGKGKGGGKGSGKGTRRAGARPAVGHAAVDYAPDRGVVVPAPVLQSPSDKRVAVVHESAPPCTENPKNHPERPQEEDPASRHGSSHNSVEDRAAPPNSEDRTRAFLLDRVLGMGSLKRHFDLRHRVCQ